MIEMLDRQSYMKKTEIVVVSALSEEDIQNKGGLPQGIKVYQKPIPFDQIEQDAKQCLENI